MKFKKKDVEQAYLYLKSYAYHENLNLFLKERVAEFECERLELAIRKINALVKEDNPLQNSDFSKWIEKIDFHLLPKAVLASDSNGMNDQAEGRFISNVRDSEAYNVEKLNYFINAPIELHIIDMLWCLVAGPTLDKQLKGDCYGNRLTEPVLSLSLIHI